MWSWLGWWRRRRCRRWWFGAAAAGPTIFLTTHVSRPLSTRTHTRTHAHTHTRTHTRTHAHAYTHLHTRARAQSPFRYLTSYIIKGELDTANAFAILARASKTREDFAAQNRADAPDRPDPTEAMLTLRCVLQLAGSVDMPATLAATVLLDYPLEYSSGMPVRVFLDKVQQMTIAGFDALFPGTAVSPPLPGDLTALAATAVTVEQSSAAARLGIRLEYPGALVLWVEPGGAGHCANVPVGARLVEIRGSAVAASAGAAQRAGWAYDGDRDEWVATVTQATEEADVVALMDCSTFPRRWLFSAAAPRFGQQEVDLDDETGDGMPHSAGAAAAGATRSTSRAADDDTDTEDDEAKDTNPADGAPPSRPASATVADDNGGRVQQDGRGGLCLVNNVQHYALRETGKRAVGGFTADYHLLNFCRNVTTRPHAKLPIQVVRDEYQNTKKAAPLPAVNRSTSRLLKALGLSTELLDKWRKAGTATAKLTKRGYLLILQWLDATDGGLRKEHPQFKGRELREYQREYRRDIVIGGKIPPRAGSAEEIARFTLLCFRPWSITEGIEGGGTFGAAAAVQLTRDLLTVQIAAAAVEVGDRIRSRPIGQGDAMDVGDGDADEGASHEIVGITPGTFLVRCLVDGHCALGAAVRGGARSVPRADSWDITRVCSSWGEALRHWTLRERLVSDRRWFARGGKLCHPLLEECWNRLEGSTRAERMKADRDAESAATAAERLEALPEEVQEYITAGMLAADPGVAGLLDGSLDIQWANVMRGSAEGQAEGLTHAWAALVREGIAASPASPAGASPLAGQPGRRTEEVTPGYLLAAMGPTTRIAKPAGRTAAAAAVAAAEAASLIGRGGGTATVTAADVKKGYEDLAERLLLGESFVPPPPPGAPGSSGARPPPPAAGGTVRRDEVLQEAVPGTTPTDPLTPPSPESLAAGFLVPRAAACVPGIVEWGVLRGLDAEQLYLLVKRWVRFQLAADKSSDEDPTAHPCPRLLLGVEPGPPRRELCDALLRPLLVYGAPGSGKSYCHMVYSKYLTLRGFGGQHQTVAYCGAAASRVGGQTMHSVLGLNSRRKGDPRDAGGGDLGEEKRGSDPARVQMLQKLREMSLEEIWAIPNSLVQKASEAANDLRGRPGRFFGDMLISGNGDPFQKQWGGEELYGPPLDRARPGDTTAAAGKERQRIERKARGTLIMREAFTNVHFLDSQHRAGACPLQQHTIRRLRHGSGDKALHDTIRCFNLLERASAEDRARFAFADVIAATHRLLAPVLQDHPRAWADRHNIRAVVWEQPDVVVAVGGVRCTSPVAPPRWMRELIRGNRCALHQKKTGNIGSDFVYISRTLEGHPEGVPGYSYALCKTGGGTPSVGSTGAVTHATGTFVGIRPNDVDLGGEGHFEGNHWHLRGVPTLLLMKLDRSLMGDDRVHSALEPGVVPLGPKTATWTLDLKAIAPLFWEAVGKRAGLAQTYTLRRTGYMVHPTAGGTDWAWQGATVDLVLIQAFMADRAGLMVMLSRSKSFDSWKILADFEIGRLQQPPPDDLLDDVRRLRTVEAGTLVRDAPLIRAIDAELATLEAEMRAQQSPAASAGRESNEPGVNALLCGGCQLCHDGLDCASIEAMLLGGSDMYYRRLLSTLGELQEERAEHVAFVQTVCVLLCQRQRQLQRGALPVLVGVGTVGVLAVPPIGGIQRTIMALLGHDLSDRFVLAAAQESVAAVETTAACASVFAEWKCAWIFHARLAGIATLRTGLEALLAGKDPVGQKHAKTGQWERLCADCSGLEPVRDYKEHGGKGGKGSRTPLWLCAECAGLRRDGLQVRGVGGDRFHTLVEGGGGGALRGRAKPVRGRRRAGVGPAAVWCPVDSVVPDSVSSPLPPPPPPPASRVSQVWHSVSAVRRAAPCATGGGSEASQCPRVRPRARACTGGGGAGGSPARGGCRQSGGRPGRAWPGGWE